MLCDSFYLVLVIHLESINSNLPQAVDKPGAPVLGKCGNLGSRHPLKCLSLSLRRRPVEHPPGFPYFGPPPDAWIFVWFPAPAMFLAAVFASDRFGSFEQPVCRRILGRAGPGLTLFGGVSRRRLPCSSNYWAATTFETDIASFRQDRWPEGHLFCVSGFMAANTQECFVSN